MLKTTYTTWQEAVRNIVIHILNINQGGSLTLTASSATTTVNHSAAKKNSLIFLFPTNVDAAAEVGGGTIYTSAKNTGSFVLTHANNATTRTFDYLIINKL